MVLVGLEILKHKRYWLGAVAIGTITLGLSGCVGDTREDQALNAGIHARQTNVPAVPADLQRKRELDRIERAKIYNKAQAKRTEESRARSDRKAKNKLGRRRAAQRRRLRKAGRIKEAGERRVLLGGDGGGAGGGH